MTNQLSAPSLELATTGEPPGEGASSRSRSPWFANRSLLTGIGLLGLIGLLGIFAPLVTQHDPLAQDAANPLAGPSASHWLGTDQLGRDVWARLIYSIRMDIPVSLLAVVAPFVIGVLLGLLAGYFGTLVDTAVMRIAEIVLAFPFMVLAITLVFALGSGTTSVLVSFTTIGWVAYMMIVRGEVLREKHAEYILAAQSLGYSRRRILLRHLLPNVLTQAVVYAMSSVVGTITAIVGLGFLGLGIAPPTPEWGSMIADGTPFLTTHWIMATAPGVAVIIVGFALSLCGDGLADILRGE